MTSSETDAIRESDATFRALAENSPTAIFISEKERFRYVNPALEAITGYSRADLLKLDKIDLVHPDERHLTQQRQAARRRNDKAGYGRFEAKIRTRNGETRWIDVTLTPFEYEARPAFFGTAIDITDRKRLAERVVQSERLEAVGRLAGGIAHDFNNLLLVISGQTERLAEELAGHPLRDAVVAIQQSAQRAARLTDQLLAFSRRQVLMPSAMRLNDVLEALEPRLRQIVGADVALQSNVAADLPTVRIDRTRLEEAIVELLRNARDAMAGRGSVIITTDVIDVDEAMVRSHPWLPLKRFVRIRMTDTGPGIPPEVRQHLFEPFFSTKPPDARAGMGLPTVYGMVKQSGGFIWVDSEAGEGAAVTILLPPWEADRAAVPTPPRGRSGHRVLLVEDEQPVRELLTFLLEREGFTVRVAKTAEEALEVDDAHEFDLLVTDVVLPKMTGADLARIIRDRAPQMRVLFMSGYAGDAVLTPDDFGAGRAFIQKPFGSKALVECVRELLDLPGT